MAAVFEVSADRLQIEDRKAPAAAHRWQDGFMPIVLARWHRRELTPAYVARMMIIASRVLMCWVLYLALTLAPSEHRSHWVVLDVLEIIVLRVVAKALVYGQRWRVVRYALFAAPLFLYDAAMDITSSHQELAELAIASVMALLVELPLSAGMFLLATRCALYRPPQSLRVSS